MKDDSRTARIIALAEHGLVNTEIGEIVGLKKARVSQILHEVGRLDLCGYDRRRAASTQKGRPRKARTKRKLPSPEYVRLAITYAPETGTFTWNYRPDRANRWNGRHAGERAGGWNAVHRYYEIRLDGTLWYGHQIAWLWAKGNIPDGFEIDHANRDRSDNRLHNLRLATKAQNNINRTPTVRSLPLGVYKKGSRFVASLSDRRLGLFSTPEEASAAYWKARRAAYGEF